MFLHYLIELFAVIDKALVKKAQNLKYLMRLWLLRWIFDRHCKAASSYFDAVLLAKTSSVEAHTKL